jgi:8-oxo-dGTP pyrophosphatase MutT (NUDIX family)
VKHRWHDGTTSWILPGGALLPGEKPEEAVLRELDEETSLKGTIVRFLFTMPYDLGTSATFLVEVDATAQVSLGCDPEEAQESSKMLQGAAWFPIKDVRDNPEVRQVLACLDGLVPEPDEEEESSQPCV